LGFRRANVNCGKSEEVKELGLSRRGKEWRGRSGVVGDWGVTGI